MGIEMDGEWIMVTFFFSLDILSKSIIPGNMCPMVPPVSGSMPPVSTSMPQGQCWVLASRALSDQASSICKSHPSLAATAERIKWTTESSCCMDSFLWRY